MKEEWVKEYPKKSLKNMADYGIWTHNLWLPYRGDTPNIRIIQYTNDSARHG